MTAEITIELLTQYCVCPNQKVNLAVEGECPSSGSLWVGNKEPEVTNNLLQMLCGLEFSPFEGSVISEGDMIIRTYKGKITYPSKYNNVSVFYGQIPFRKGYLPNEKEFETWTCCCLKTILAIKTAESHIQSGFFFEDGG